MVTTLVSGSTRLGQGTVPYTGVDDQLDPWIPWAVAEDVAITGTRSSGFGDDGGGGFVASGEVVTQAWRIDATSKALLALPPEIADMLESTAASIHMQHVDDSSSFTSFSTFAGPGAAFFRTTDFIDGVQQGAPGDQDITGWSDTAPFDKIQVNQRIDTDNNCQLSVSMGDVIPTDFLGSEVWDKNGVAWQNDRSRDTYPAGLVSVFPPPGNVGVLPRNVTFGNGQLSIEIPLV